MKGILGYSDKPVVSGDVKGDAHFSVFSARDTLIVGDNLAKVVARYDDEWGYSVRIADLRHYIAVRKLVVQRATSSDKAFMPTRFPILTQPNKPCVKKE
jgi:Glyceraldehyde 3-phosphate dehydrogenase, C-terminal domain